MISSWIKRTLGVSQAPDPKPAAQAVFDASRAPGFFIELGVPDTFDGRFETLALHLHLLLVRLRRDGEAGAAFSQNVFDVVTGHFDEALREIGVGDMSVGKRAKGMTRGLYGRLSAYNAGFNAETPDAMRDALRRNLYGTVDEAQDEWIDAVIAYQETVTAHLMALPLTAIQEGKNLFPALETRK